MRINIHFSFKGELKLPIGYNNFIQALIYSHILDTNKREQLHNYGYMVGAKKIKLMTFSKLFGNYILNKDSISFKSPVNFIFSSYDDELVSEISYNLLTDDNMYLNGTKLNVIDLKPSFFDESYYRNINYYIIEMLSPVTVYSTDINKKTYFSPWDSRFGEAIKNNLLTKLKAANIGNANFDFHITPNNIKNSKDEKIIYFKDTLIKGYNGLYTIRTDAAVMKLLYYAGLGSKNSEGFGCFKILGDKYD